MGKKDKKETEEEASLRAEIKERVVGYIVAAFGLVAGLAWNEAVKALIEQYFPLQNGGGVVPKFVYALVITIFIVLISIYLLRLAKVKKK